MNYSEFVRSRFKPGEKIAAEMTPHKAALLNGKAFLFYAMSDVLDGAKKYAIYNKANHFSSYVLLQENLDRFKDFTITPQQAELLHAAIGLAGEAGELLDTVRKHVFEGQPMNRKNCIEEMGDLGFFFESMLQALDVDRAYIEAANQAKLDERFKDGYSDKAAQERADKAGEE